MKIKLSKKTKTFLSVATAIIASTAVTTLLTSCSSAKQSDIIDTGGYDKEYGINDVTYARMEDDFKTLFSFLDNREVKSMNNVLEGGINSPIRHLLNCHRGTNFTGQQKIVEIYLLKRSMF